VKCIEAAGDSRAVLGSNAFILDSVQQKEGKEGKDS
jgi:hypothetical protein